MFQIKNGNWVVKYLFAVIFSFCINTVFIYSQSNNQLNLRVGNLSGKFTLDGKLNEDFWERTDSISCLTLVVPDEGRKSDIPTIVKVVANKDEILFGIKCFDAEPDKLVSYSKARDSDLNSEDRIKIVLDTFLDGRTGYVFAVNPSGARYDALVINGGDDENSNWDGIWNAKTFIASAEWSAEILIPAKTLNFDRNLNEWGFNIERKIQRFLRKERWAGAKKDFKVSQTSQAGRLTGLPKFDIGLGLLIKPSTIDNMSKTYQKNPLNKWSNSLDIIEKFTPNLNVEATINTDFAETEVDARKTNLTRFPLFFPEKRTFFLESADIYNFGLGLDGEIVPFFSRRIGLLNGETVPINFGGKLNGKIGNSNFGALITRTGKVGGLTSASTMGVFRFKHNVLKESYIGLIGTYGDPLNRKNSWTAGIDFNYRSTEFLSNNNFLAGFWGLINNRDSLAGKKYAFGFSVSYPNDLWDIGLSYKKIGNEFDPSLGFILRKNVNEYKGNINYTPRPETKIFWQIYLESSFDLFTDLNNNWQTYELDLVPLKTEFSTGDEISFGLKPQGENLKENFEIVDGVIIPPSKYQWLRYDAEISSAKKRQVQASLEWQFGNFYTGKLDEYSLDLFWKASSLFNFEFTYDRSIGTLPVGNFDETVYGGRIQFNYSSDLQLSSFIQYDNQSKTLGTNTRLRWTFNPLGDLFLVYNHNIRNYYKNKWLFSDNQFIIKITYGFWF